MESPEYIIVLFDSPCFATKSIAFPYEEFVEVRKSDYKRLMRFTRKREHLGNMIDDFIIMREYNDEVSGDKDVDSKRGENFLCTLYTYIDQLHWLMEDDEFPQNDIKWFGKSFLNVVKGFKHIENYKKCKEITNINPSGVAIRLCQAGIL